MCVYVYSCTLAMHTCPRARIRTSPYRFSLPPRIRNGLSPPRFIPLPPASRQSILSFLRVYHDPILLSPDVLSGDASKVTCTRCTSSYTCWTNSPLGRPSDEPSCKRGEIRIHRRGRSVSKLLLSREFQHNFALGSRGRQWNNFLSLNKNNL